MEWRTVGAKELYKPYKSVANFFKNNFEKPLDNQHKMCYNIRAVRTGTYWQIKKWVANLPPNMKGDYYD